MRGPLAAALALFALVALPGCLDASGVAPPPAEPLSDGVVEEGPAWEVYRESAVVPLWVGVAGARAHAEGATQFVFDPTPGFNAVVVEARWEPSAPAPLEPRLKLLFLGNDRTILGEAEGTSPLVLRLDPTTFSADGPYTAYAVGAEDTVGITPDQPYELAVSFHHAPGPAPADYSALDG